MEREDKIGLGIGYLGIILMTIWMCVFCGYTLSKGVSVANKGVLG
jgi:hypothetical protein